MPVTAKVQNQIIELTGSFSQAKDFCKSFPGRKWNGVEKVWEMPASVTLKKFIRLAEEAGVHDAHLTEEAEDDQQNVVVLRPSTVGDIEIQIPGQPSLEIVDAEAAINLIRGAKENGIALKVERYVVTGYGAQRHRIDDRVWAAARAATGLSDFEQAKYTSSEIRL